ncbi:sensor histidine kinase [Paenibacillus sp. NPDC056579]|uniref:sensor histidine kinase n=1 Tax=Paenibacillus sp. NPDC056579 TaxID=3345871 RepID=UPI00368AD4B0
MYKRSLLVKLLVWMLMATVIPFTCSNLISYRSTSAALEANMIELNHKTMNIGMDNLKKYLQELNQLSVSWYYDQSLINYLWLDKPDFDSGSYIDRQLAFLYFSRPEIKLVNYYSAMSGQQYIKFNYSVWSSPQQPQLPPNVKDEWTNLPVYETKVMNDSRFLVINRKLIDYPKPNVLGLLSMYFTMDEIKRLSTQLLDPDHESVFIYMNDSQQLIYASSEESAPHLDETTLRDITKEPQQTHWNGQFRGEQGVFLAVSDRFLEMPLTIVKFIPSTFINQAAKQTLDRSMVIQFIALAFVILFTVILSYSTIAPIKRLIRNMTRVEIGQFDVEQFKKREDEIGILELRFQTMVRNLKEMIIREYQQRIEISTAQLKMLQAQINPHFLYNTLQSIGTTALRHNIEEISDKISQLGAILRYSMDLDTETVALQKELDHIRDYLSLQESRFKHKLTYTIHCESSAAKRMVPKMILQPLVENSIVHGIESGTGQGAIRLEITMDDALILRIIDNGRGMDQTAIEQLKQRFAKQRLLQPEEDGIGLINVLQRLRITYGDGFAWTMESKPYEKTEIVLIIPIQEGT